MIEFCSERLASTIQNIKIFHGQKPLPSHYENIPAFEKDFVGYNYEFLNQVISDHRKKLISGLIILVMILKLRQSLEDQQVLH